METELSKHPKHVSDSKFFLETNQKIRKIGTKMLTLATLEFGHQKKLVGKERKKRKKRKKLESGFLTTKKIDYFFVKTTQFTDFKIGVFH